MSIYILTSEFFKGQNIYKIGLTTETEEDLLSAYSRYLPMPIILFYKETNNYEECEWHLKKKYMDNRIVNGSGNKQEWIKGILYDYIVEDIKQYICNNIEPIYNIKVDKKKDLTAQVFAVFEKLCEDAEIGTFCNIKKVLYICNEILRKHGHMIISKTGLINTHAGYLQQVRKDGYKTTPKILEYDNNGEFVSVCNVDTVGKVIFGFKSFSQEHFKNDKLQTIIAKTPFGYARNYTYRQTLLLIKYWSGTDIDDDYIPEIIEINLELSPILRVYCDKKGVVSYLRNDSIDKIDEKSKFKSKSKSASVSASDYFLRTIYESSNYVFGSGIFYRKMDNMSAEDVLTAFLQSDFFISEEETYTMEELDDIVIEYLENRGLHADLLSWPDIVIKLGICSSDGDKYIFM